MRTLRYGFFGEDAAQREFLVAYLNWRTREEPSLQFEAITYFGKQFGPMNNLVVDRRCFDACREAFELGHPRLDWLFIGRDVDSFELARHQYLTEALRKKIPAKWHGRTLLLLPVQCAEHWLFYLANYPRRDPLETQPKDYVKQRVYQDLTQPKTAIRTALLATLDAARIDWLAEVSASFRTFHQQTNSYAAILPSS